jgi:hypothetical protein
MADPSNDQLTIYSNDMKSYGLRNGVAQFLKIRANRCAWSGWTVRRRTAHRRDDAGFEAAFLARSSGAGARAVDRGGGNGVGHEGSRVRVQDARRARCAGQSRRARLRARAADHNHLGYNEIDTVLIAQLTGQRKQEPARGAPRPTTVRDSESRIDRQRRAAAARVGNAAAHGQPARSRRSAGDVRVESFIDELAAAAKADPVDSV